ncbi:MAG TPA: LacI family DNA-binding transcriptional regulator, partial [Capillimicrobium sp.]
MPDRRPTMRDVAAEAGVSLKSVSRVVNAEPGVSGALAARVTEAIARLGYRPDPTATTLRRADHRSRTIAAVLEDLANPFSATVHSAVVDALRGHGVLVLSASTEEDPAREREAVLALLDRRVDGIVLMPTTTDHAWLSPEEIGDQHLVMVDRPAPGFPADLVVSGNHDGARAATEHLLRGGHRRIAFLGGPAAMHTAAERLAGYRAALAAAGAPSLERTGLRDAEAARVAVTELLATAPASAPTAVFAAQNRL